MFVRRKVKRLDLMPQRVHTRLAPHRDSSGRLGELCSHSRRSRPGEPGNQERKKHPFMLAPAAVWIGPNRIRTIRRNFTLIQRQRLLTSAVAADGSFVRKVRAAA